MPTPGNAMRSLCACSSTATGRTAGPAEKLKTRVVVGMTILLLVISIVARRLDQVRQQAVPKLRLEPGGLRRHDPASIGNRHQILNVDRIQRKRHRGSARTDAGFKLRCAPGTSDEVNPFVG